MKKMEDLNVCFALLIILRGWNIQIDFERDHPKSTTDLYLTTDQNIGDYGLPIDIFVG